MNSCIGCEHWTGAECLCPPGGVCHPECRSEPGDYEVDGDLFVNFDEEARI